MIEPQDNIKNPAVGHFFPLPNAIFHLGLSAEEIATYAYLLYCEDRKTFQCYPSFSTIGNHIGKTKNSVKKYVDGLRDKGLISTQTTKERAFLGSARRERERRVRAMHRGLALQHAMPVGGV